MKRILSIAVMVCALPALANAAKGTLQIWSQTSGGKITVVGPFFDTNTKTYVNNSKVVLTSAYGYVYKNYSGAAKPSATISPNTGYNIGSYTVDSVPGTGVPTTNPVSVPSVTSAVTAIFLYGGVVNTVSAMASAGTGGSVNMTQVSNIYKGQTLYTPMTFKFMPMAGYKVSSITITGDTTGVVTSPAVSTAQTGQTVTVIFPSGYKFTDNVNVAGSFTYASTATARVGAPQTVAPNQSVTLSGAASLGSISSYLWTQAAGPAVATITTPYGATTTVTGLTTVGTYKFKLTVNSGQSSALASVYVSNTLVQTVRTQCVDCHNGNGIGSGYTATGIYATWAASAHANGVACAACHIGANTSGHPGTVNSVTVSPTTFMLTGPANGYPMGSNFCAQCHSKADQIVSSYNASPHPQRTSGPATCAGCHVDPHAVISTIDPCMRCHVDSYGNVSGHPVDIGENSCLSCHDPHSTAAFMTSGAPHYNNITTGMYAASYMTSRAACKDCHYGSTANRAIRQQWYTSGHARVTGLPWIYNDFKTMDGCVQCHTTTGFIAYSTGKVKAAWGVASDKTKEVLTCIGCHSDITTGVLRTVTPVSPYANDPYVNPNVGKSNVCMDCHSGTNSGLSITAKLNATADFTKLAFVEPHFLAAGGILQGKAGYQFGEQDYASLTNTHTTIGIGNTNGTGTGGPCIACHKNPVNGHTFVAGFQNGTVSLCANCHGTYIDAAKLTTDKAAFANALYILNLQLAAKNYSYSPTSPNFSNRDWGYGQTGANTMGAAFNYALLFSEPGAYAHNSAYAKQLILDSIDYLDDGIINGSVETTVQAMAGTGKITQAQADTLIAYKSVGVCASCHGELPNSHPVHTKNDPATCDSCHTGTTTNGTSIRAGSTLHINGYVDVTFDTAKTGTSVTWTAGTKTCANIQCHGTGSAPAQWGSTSCLGCHSVPQGSRAAITPQFGGNSHHVQGQLTDAQCYQCHWEANSDGTINSSYHGGSAGSPVDLVVYGANSRPSDYHITDTVSAVQYTANGQREEIQKINTHCLGCHSDKNNTATPFGDGKTPRQYAWDATSVAARYAQTGVTTWGKYPTVANAAQKNISKAYSAHGNAAANKRGWDTTNGVDGAITDNSGSAAVQCFDCHNSHGSSVTGVTTRYASATANGGILKDTTVERSGALVAYKPYAGGSATDKNSRNPGASLCLDCHMNQNATTTPWGYSTYGASKQILGYWDLPYMSYSGAGAKQRYAYKGANLVKGGHFGASSPLIPGAMSSIGGLCTPCHDPHGVSPTLGANQQYAVPLLKGTWVTSPYKEDVAPVINSAQIGIGNFVNGYIGYHIDQNTFGADILGAAPGAIREQDTQFGGLCLSCHPKESLTRTTTPASPNPWKSKERVHEAVKGWKTSDGTVKHDYTCSKCHSAHTGSVLPRLMVTNCLNSMHKGRVPSNSAPAVSSGGSGSGCGGGSGNGRIPGSYSGSGEPCEGDTAGPAPGDHTVGCHETANNSVDGTDQSWNVVTPWSRNILYPPTLIDHSSTGCNGSCSMTLSWMPSISPDGHPVQYNVQVSDSASFTAPNYTSGWLSGTSWAQALATSKTWYWRVQSRDSDPSHTTPLVSVWSPASSFILVPITPPAAPTLIHRADTLCTTGSCTDQLSWDPVASADGDPVWYQLQVSGLANFSTLQYSSGFFSGTSQAPPLPVGQTWYWRVRAIDSVHSSITSGWSSDSFRSVALSIPVLNAQPNSICASSCPNTLSWNASTISPPGDPLQYYAEVDTVNTFNSGAGQNSGWLGTTSNSFTLATNKNYFWRVTARDAANTALVTAPSATGTFGLSNGAPPPAPVLANPANGFSAESCDSSYYMTFGWNALSKPVQYNVQVSTDPTFTTVSYSSDWITTTSWATGLFTTNTYYWRVQARDLLSLATGPWSASQSFTITDTGPCATTCPIVYTWDGQQFAFESDVYTKGKLGLKYSTGFLKPNPNDYYLLLNDPAKTADNNYELRIVEERKETDYLDNLKLYTIDYPESRNVYSEILFTGTTYVDPVSVLHTVAKTLQTPRVMTQVGTGADVAARLAASDGNYLVLSNDRNLDFNWQTVELDLGDQSQAPRIKLVIDAVSDFPTTPSGLQRASSLDYNGQRTKIEVLDANRNWVLVPATTKELPIPKGFRRPYILDISNVFLTNVYKVRLSFLYKTHIDAISFDTTADEPVSLNLVPLQSANLDYHGANTTIGISEIYQYLYSNLTDTRLAYMPGNYTRFGDVTPLLTQTDDKFVIFGKGDQLSLKFTGETSRPIGTARRFMLYFDGYYKAQNNVSIPNTVEPLPFAAMSNYPYDPTVENYPTDVDHINYQQEYNTRQYQ